MYVDSIGYTHLQGEVQNYSGAPVYDAKVSVTYYNANGSVAGSDYTYTYATLIQPGEKDPFNAISNPQSGWTTYVTSLSYDTTDYVTYSHSFSFTGQNQFSDSFYEYYTGQVTNTSGQTLQFPEVLITGYDASGNVVVTDFTFANGPNTIAAGATQSYQFDELLSRSLLVASTAFLAEGWH